MKYRRRRHRTVIYKPDNSRVRMNGKRANRKLAIRRVYQAWSGIVQYSVDRVVGRSSIFLWLIMLGCVLLLFALMASASADDDAVCPTVKAVRHLHLHDMLGRWYVVQYYASSEEEAAYRCMRVDLSVSISSSLRINMNFTYAFADDPLAERLQGNITWQLPDPGRPAHWLHREDIYEGVYNTYVLDSDYTTWALLLHCAEKMGSPRYLSSFILSRQPSLPKNVQNYLRDKLTRYAIDLEYMFDMKQDDCDNLTDLSQERALLGVNLNSDRKHPLQRNHRPSLKHRKSKNEID